VRLRDRERWGVGRKKREGGEVSENCR
jgi:hypothetical protein